MRTGFLRAKNGQSKNGTKGKEVVHHWREKAEVEDCVHFVYPITARRIHKSDRKIETLAYDEQQRILEIAFKTGQVWQLAGVPPNVYAEFPTPLSRPF